MQAANGPTGVRSFVKTPEYPEGVFRAAKTTAYPAAIALAATWDPGLVGRVAAGIGEECNECGVDWLLAPSLHVVRVPQGGRNFESYGEDPLLSPGWRIGREPFPFKNLLTALRNKFLY